MTKKGDTQPQWTRLEEIQACRMREAGRPIAEIAAALGKTYGAVSVRLSKLGATKKGDRPRRKRDELRAAVAAAFSEPGKAANGNPTPRSDRDVAALLGCTTQEVFKVRKAIGLPTKMTPKRIGMRIRRRPEWGQAGKSYGATNDTPLTDAQKTLAADYFGEIGKAVFRWRSRVADADAVESAAALGLVAAARNYDPASGVPFGPYAARRIDGAVADALRDQSRPLGYRKDGDEFPHTFGMGDLPL